MRRSALVASASRPLAVAVTAALVTVAGLASPVLAQQAPDTGSPERLRDDLRALVQQARDRVFPALVNVSVITVDFQGGKETKGGSVGSGTIFSADGHVITNYHVVEDGKRYRVTLADKQEVGATLVGTDPLTDLAVLKINLDELKDPRSLPVAQWGDSNELIVGDYVMAMGSPFSLSRSVTLGIVSNADRVFTAGAGDEMDEMEFNPGQRTGIFTRWIQHDAAINPGNSGGPLVNMQGQIIGINTLGGTNMGFASPSSLARPVAESLVKHGTVPRSYVGVALKSIKRSDFTRGAILNSVVEDGPAWKAGLRPGDLILTLDGTDATARFAEQIPALARLIAEKPIGSNLEVTYERAGKEAKATIVTEKLLADRGDEAALRTWGMSALQITEQLAKDRKLESTQGAMVTGVRSSGPADTAEPQINPGDVLLAINGTKVESLAGLVEQYTKIMAVDPAPEYVLIEFDRRGKNNVTVIKPRPDKKEDPPRELPKAWIAIATQPVLKELAAQLATQLGHAGEQGFRVTRIYPGTNAAKSELRTGDIIVALNGEKLAPRTLQDAGLFNRRVRQLASEGDATLSVLRGSEKLELRVPLERTRIGPEEALRDQNKDFDITVRELTFFDRDELRLDDDAKGVLVENTERAGWAGLAGVFPGDLLQKIGDAEITDIPSWRKAMADIAKRQPEKVTFVVLRGTRTYFLFAEPDWKPQAEEK
jgi:serine protease Do